MKTSFVIYTAAAIGLSSLVLAGCAKKVTPASGTLDIFDDGIVEERRLPPDSPPPILNQAPIVEMDLPPRATGAGEQSSPPTMLQDVLFDYDAWTIRGDMTSVLAGNARWMKAHGDAKIQVEGYCDERGTNEYNLVLGERRAKAVVDFLMQSGVSVAQLSLISYGEESPVCADDTDTCHQKNRRARFAVR